MSYKRSVLLFLAIIFAAFLGGILAVGYTTSREAKARAAAVEDLRERVELLKKTLRFWGEQIEYAETQATIARGSCRELEERLRALEKAQKADAGMYLAERVKRLELQADELERRLKALASGEAPAKATRRP